MVISTYGKDKKQEKRKVNADKKGENKIFVIRFNEINLAGYTRLRRKNAKLDIDVLQLVVS